MNLIFAQSNALGNERAQSILQNSLELNRITAESWERIWDVVINPAEPLWQSMIYISGIIFFICFIIHIISKADDLAVSKKEVRITFTRLFFGLLLILGNGTVLANLLRILHGIGQYFVSVVLNFTLAGVKISEAIGSIQNTTVANARAREIFAECVNQTGTAADECIYDPVKIDQARDLLQSLSGNAPLQKTILEQLVNGVTANLTAIVSLPFLNAIEMTCNILQWCFMNGFQISAILTALYGGIFISLAFLPGSGISIAQWFVNYIQLLLFPSAYALIVGLVANVLNLIEQQGQPLGGVFLDVAFLVFISIFGAILAWANIKQMGTGVFEAVLSSAKNTAEAGTTVVSGGADILTKTKGIKALQG